MNSRRILGIGVVWAASLAGSAIVGGCSTDATPNVTMRPDAPVVPDVVSAKALAERLQPTSGERALLVNFWATW